MVAEHWLWRQGKIEREWTSEQEGLEEKLTVPSSNLPRLVGEMGTLVMATEAICWIVQPVAKHLLDDGDGSNRVVDDDLCEAFDVQQTRSQNNQLSLFSRQLACVLAQINEGTEFEIWRRMHNQFSLPEKTRAKNLLAIAPSSLAPRLSSGRMSRLSSSLQWTDGYRPATDSSHDSHVFQRRANNDQNEANVFSHL